MPSPWRRPAFEVRTGLGVAESGAIADGGRRAMVEKTGGGTLVLKRPQLLPRTAIADGTFRVGNVSALGTGAVDLTASGRCSISMAIRVEIRGLAAWRPAPATFDAGSTSQPGCGRWRRPSFAGILADPRRRITTPSPNRAGNPDPERRQHRGRHLQRAAGHAVAGQRHGHEQQGLPGGGERRPGDHQRRRRDHRGACLFRRSQRRRHGQPERRRPDVAGRPRSMPSPARSPGPAQLHRPRQRGLVTDP